MEYFGGVPEFSVKKVRSLKHPHFTMRQVFLLNPKADMALMLANRAVTGEEGEEDLAIFQEDHAGYLNQMGADHLDQERENFAPEFKAVYNDEDGPPFEVTYRLVQSGEFHGVLDAENEAPPLSQGIYETPDDENFPLALVEWEGEWIAAWFGKELRKDQVSFLRAS